MTTEMKQDIFNTLFWRKRLDEVRGREDVLHQAIFKCHPTKWKAIENKHRKILASIINPTDSILDCGCAWGRLLNLLPKDWHGIYTGVDLSPDFIELARLRHPLHQFSVLDLRNIDQISQNQDNSTRYQFRYNWAILISMRPMIIRNAGDEVWLEIESKILKVANRILFLEYDEDDEGTVYPLEELPI